MSTRSDSGAKFAVKLIGPHRSAIILVAAVLAQLLQPADCMANSAVRTRVVTWGNTWADVPADLTNAVHISAGDNVGMAATADKRLVIWGNNFYGQMDVPPDVTNVVAVAAGHAHCLALRDDGTVVAWGSGKTSLGYFAWPENGQAIVPPGLRDVKAIVAGYRNSLALRSNGTVVCWGNNEFYSQNNVPASVDGSTDIACYQDFCLALKTNGTVVKWGAAYAGLGSVPAGLNGVMDIAAGPFRGLALKTDGTAVAWGTSNVGEGVIPAGFNGVKSIVAGYYHNLALRTNGTVFAWGGNYDGQTNVPPGLTNVIQISARGFQSMVLIDDSIPAPPVIAVQPQSRTNNTGSSATFFVTVSVASTPPLSYQWLKDGVPLINGPNVSGALDQTLNLFVTESADAADYSVVVSNAGGSVTSSVARLTVLGGAPVILQPPTDTTAVLGSTVRLTVSAGGTEPLSYQWFKNDSPIPSPNGSSLWLFNVGESDTAAYSVEVSNSSGVARSSNALLIVSSCAPKPPGLAAWWRAEGNSSDSADGSHATGSGITYSQGYAGLAFGYNGTSSSLVAPASSNLRVTNFTVEGWVFSLDSSTPRPIIEWAAASGQAGVQIWVNKGTGNQTSPGSLYIGLRGISNTGLRENVIGSMPPFQWTHFAVSVSVGEFGTGISYYINGNWQGGIGYIVPFTPNTALPVNIGVRPAGSAEGLGGRRFLGQIDELAIYKRTLTDDEVRSIYTASVYGKCLAGNEPFIITQPTNQTVATGADVVFTASAAGALPLSYQWRRNNVDLPGATAATLMLSGVAMAQAGVYTVLASNAYGSSLSSNAVLTVEPLPSEPRFLAQSHAFPGVRNGSLAWADFDNDGDLDLFMAGDAAGAIASSFSRVYRNDDGTFVNSGYVLPAYRSSSADWADFDKDGFLDLVVTGLTDYDPAGTRVFRNLGGTNFVQAALLPGVFDGRAAWGDFNLDGYPDLAVTGASLGGGPSLSRVYVNNSGTGFTLFAVLAPEFYHGTVDWADYDHDGDPDLLLFGEIGDLRFGGHIYRNDRTGFNAAGQIVVASGARGQWFDANNDGWADVLVLAHSQANSYVLLNDHSGGFTNGGTLGMLGASAVADCDNDGWSDVLIAGYRYSSAIGNFVYGRTSLYQNTGTNVWLDHSNLVANLEAAAASWGDYDRDGRIDLILHGQQGSTYRTFLYRNVTSLTNNAPAAPTGLVAVPMVNGAALSWSPAADANQSGGLTYNVRIGSLPGAADVLNPESAANGWRRVVRRGNADGRTSLTVSGLTPGATYYWSVQAVDHAFAGSPFATEGAFTFTNHPPSATNQNIALDEDTHRVIVLTGSDPEAQPLNYVITDPPTNGVLTGVAPNLTYRPNTNYFGPDSFRFKVSDGELESAPATVGITVNAVNDPPSFTRGPDITVLEDAGLQTIPGWATDISPGASNESNQPLIFYVYPGTTAAFTSTPTLQTNGTLSFQFSPNFNGTVAVGIQLTDALGTLPTPQNSSPVQTVLLTATPVNDMPQAYEFFATTAEDTTRELTPTGFDIDGDILSFLIVTNPAHGTLSGVPPNLLYTPDTNYFGADAFAFVATDGQTSSPPAVVTLTITPVNDAPVARIELSPLSVFPGFTNLIVISLNGTNATVGLDGTGSSDVEDDPLTYSWREGTNQLATVATATADLAAGSHELTLEVSDGSDTGTATAELEIITLQESVGLVIQTLQDSGLNRTTIRPLTASLKAAAAAFESAQIKAGVNQLVAFQNKVRYQVEPSDPVLAAQLIAAAQTVIDSLTSTQ